MYINIYFFFSPSSSLRTKRSEVWQSHQVPFRRFGFAIRNLVTCRICNPAAIPVADNISATTGIYRYPFGHRARCNYFKNYFYPSIAIFFCPFRGLGVILSTLPSAKHLSYYIYAKKPPSQK